jgi:hypothetical protein
MASLAEIRQQYPQYSDMSDQELADAMHKKFYADIPKDDFYKRIGFQAQPERSLGEQALRLAETGAQGFMASAAETFGAIPDASAWITNKLGLTNLEPGAWTNAIKEGSQTAQQAVSAPINEILGRTGAPIQPETSAEKFAFGAGHGVGDAASILLPASAVANTARAGTVTQRVAQTMAAQPVMQAVAGGVGGGVGEATDNPLLGLLAAMAVPVGTAVGRGIITPVANRLSPEQQRLAAQAAAEGINLTAGQQTGSKPLQAAESVFQQLPFTAGRQNAIREAQQQAFNTAVLGRAGVNANAAAPDVLDDAARALGQQFEQLSAQTTVNLDNAFLNDLQDAATRYGTKLPTNVRPIFQSYIDDILTQGNAMAGNVYQQARSDLTRQAKSLNNSDPGLATALRAVRDALDDAAERSMPANLQDAWQTTRRQYANLKAIINAMSRPSAGAAAGDVSPASLWSAVRQGQTKDQFARGAGELNDLARVGQAFLKQQIPDSGTPIRTFMQNLLRGGPAGAGLAIGAMGEPVTGAAVAASSLGLPPLLQSIMNSRAGQAYLTNQLLPGAGVTLPTMLAIGGAQGKNYLTAP